MSEKIDWSKAPEDATHCYEVVPEFFKKKDGKWMVWFGLAKRWAPSEIPSRHENLVYRPTTPSWSGEGLPPVGVVCEVRNAPGGWGKATIKYQGKGVTVWLWDRPDGNTDQIEFASCPDRLEFRPIRTPEQIEADERRKAIDEMVKALGMDVPGTAEYIRCGLIYDAGFRKT